MQDLSTIFGFFAIVLAVVLVPGMDMAYVFASSINGGRRVGLSAVAGIVCGGCLHLLAALTGLAALLAASATIFGALFWFGTAYVVWIGAQLIRYGAALPDSANAGATTRVAFARGISTSLLNPKAYLFMIAVLPQFIQPQSGPVWTQALLLGSIIGLTQWTVYGSVAWGGARFRQQLHQRPQLLKLIGRCMGGLLIVAALISVLRSSL